MKALWIVNVAFPEACRELGLPEPVIGGWLYGYRDALHAFYPDLQIDIVAPYDGKTLCHIDCAGSRHYLFPASTGHDALIAWMRTVREASHPDVVHLHGSEFFHALAWVKANGADHTVLSLQGLVSVYADYYMGGIEGDALRRCRTFHDWRHRDRLTDQQKRYAERGAYETELLQRIQNVAGRTSWDRAHLWAIHPEARYFTCQEVLRQPFYDARWELGACRRHRIFLSQSHYPIKGLHKFLEALPLILRHYPDTEVHIVGDDPTRRRWYQRSGYGNLIRYLMRTHKLKRHIHFVGRLDADRMVAELREAHVFVCPSAIENSSNSVCEAQLVGTPTVASYVGGLMDLIADGRSGLLYRFEETRMLALKVCSIFADDDLAHRLSAAAYEAAAQRHRRGDIARSLYDIYQTIR